MPSTLTLRCEQCGHESAAQYHYCGMCGAKLPPQQISLPLAPISKKPAGPAIEEPVQHPSSEPIRQAREPSCLAPTDDTNSRLAYLLEDDLPENHWGKFLVVLLLVVIGISVAGWHWREQLRTYLASHLTQHPNHQTGQVGTAEVPGSESGAGIPNNASATDKPMTGVGDLPVTPVQTPSAPGTGPDPVAPPGAQNSALIQNAGTGSAAQDDIATASKLSADAPSNPQGATLVPTATAAAEEAPGANEPAASAAQNRELEVASAKQEAPASPSATRKKSQSTVRQTAPTASNADQLEAQGEKYLYGTGVPTSCSLARRDLQAAAEYGNVKANRVLGTMYATGHCVSRDLRLAYRCFANALRQDPNNDRLAQDLQVLWSQMTVEERQIAIRR
jgi:hypothetical protein